MSANAKAAELNARAIPTPRGGKWTARSVINTQKACSRMPSPAWPAPDPMGSAATIGAGRCSKGFHKPPTGLRPRARLCPAPRGARGKRPSVVPPRGANRAPRGGQGALAPIIVLQHDDATPHKCGCGAEAGASAALCPRRADQPAECAANALERHATTCRRM